LTWTFSDGNAGSQGGGGPLAATGTSIINITPTNSAPLLLSFANPTMTIADNASTAARIKLADIVVEDDGLGANALSIASGLDGSSFEILDQSLYLRAGVALSRMRKPTYTVRVEASDPSVPFSTVAANFTLDIVRGTTTRPASIGALMATPGNQRVTLNWSAPADDGGSPITKYEIMVAEQTAGVWSSYRPVTRPASTATTADVTGLNNGKPHIFVVRAVNAVGAGPWATLSRVVTPIGARPGVVSALTANAGNQRVTLNWSAPTSDGGSPITNYEIMVADQTGGVWSSYRPVTRPASTATSADVTGLTNGKIHIFVVRAVNAAGAGQWVTLSRVVTPTATIPGVISVLTAAPGNQRVTLNWSAPTDDGGSPITNYEIMVADQTGGVWSSYRPVTRPSSTATSAEVTGLTNGKIHIFVVRAVNARGAGRWQTLMPTVKPLA
jgi:predicted phage tail protein